MENNQNFNQNQNQGPHNSFNPNFNPGMGGQEVLPDASAVLVLGILSLVLCGIIGLILGIIGLTKAKKSIEAYNIDPSRYSLASYKNVTAGKTCSLIGVILGSIGTVITIIYVIAIVAFASAVGSMSHY